jgi:hypothetical protein
LGSALSIGMDLGSELDLVSAPSIDTDLGSELDIGSALCESVAHKLWLSIGTGLGNELDFGSALSICTDLGSELDFWQRAKHRHGLMQRAGHKQRVVRKRCA